MSNNNTQELMELTPQQNQLIVDGLQDQLTFEMDEQRFDDIQIALSGEYTLFLDVTTRCSFWYETGDYSHTDGGGLLNVDVQINCAEVMDSDERIFAVKLDEKELSRKLLT